ncbi:MAG: DUF2079 domain-containing protein [Bacteroidales bacterium]|nr:DUF2079 domain-containing protein [Bacteroidales bacterium]
MTAKFGRLNSVYLLWAILVFFFVLYASVSLVNHYNFRTAALDLGLYTNALYDFIHFRWADSQMIKPTAENLFGGHLNLYLILFSPLSLLFGSYTLLVVQLLAILFGGYGVFSYFRLVYPEKLSLAFWAMLAFYLFFGVFSALSFDYHSNVVAAMLLPWFFLYLKRERRLISLVFLIAIMAGKENMALWMAFVVLGLVPEFWKNRRMLVLLVGFFVLAVMWFIVSVTVVIPYFSAEGEYTGFLYSALGSNPAEALRNLFLHPCDNLLNLFVNHNQSPHGDFVKTEFYVLLLVSGLPFLFFRPGYLVMLIPVLFQKMYHDNYLMWGVGDHYSIEFVPVMVVGAFSVIASVKRRGIQKLTVVLLMLGIVAGTVRVMDNTVLYTNKNKIRFYKKSHYTRTIDVAMVHQNLKRIPPDAVVSAESKVVPHLALRDKIYQFPIVKEAEFIVYTTIENTYPLDEPLFYKEIDAYRNSGDWEVFFEDKDLVILKRKVK